MFRQDGHLWNAAIVCGCVEGRPILQWNLLDPRPETSGACLLRHEQVRQRSWYVLLLVPIPSSVLIVACLDVVAMQQPIGYVDVKSEPVYFFAERNTTFSQTFQVILFEIERLNVGGAFNLESGIFTAPRTGTYFFSFSALKDGDTTTTALVSILLNDKGIGTAEGRCSGRSLVG